LIQRLRSREREKPNASGINSRRRRAPDRGDVVRRVWFAVDFSAVVVSNGSPQHTVFPLFGVTSTAKTRCYIFTPAIPKCKDLLTFFVTFDRSSY
jgi:hypothetical protein